MSNFGEVLSTKALSRSIILTIEDFRKGATAPTDATVGTTPTIPALLFNATNELLSLHVVMPANWDKTVDISFDTVWGLASGQTNADTFDLTLDYVAISKNTTGAGIAKTSTQVTGQITATTANGLAAGDIYTMAITLDRADANNPYTAANVIGLCFEFHMTNITDVADIHFITSCLNYEALD